MTRTRHFGPIRRVAALLAATVVVLGSIAVAHPAGAQSTSRNPTELTVAISSGDAVLTWTPGSHPRATGQRIIRREQRQAWQTVADVAVDATTYTDTTLTAGRKYIYAVQNVLGDRARGRSNRAVVHPADNPAAATVPNPNSLSASASGSSVILSWTPGTDSRITTQRIMRRAPKEGWTSFNVARDATTFTDSSVQSGKRYIYRVESRAGSHKLGVSNRTTVRVN